MKINRQGKISTLIELFITSFKLGCTSFGGPTAHIGYFHREYVQKLKWLNERDFTELVALCQLLPGPASSQTGFGIGVKRAGVAGGIISFLGFTLPSFVFMVFFALFLKGMDPAGSGWLHGLKIVAAAVVFQAVYSLGKNFASKPITGSIAVFSAVLLFLIPSSLAQLGAMAASGLAGYLFIKKDKLPLPDGEPFMPISKITALVSGLLFCLLFFILPALSKFGQEVSLFDGFYRSGALVFGGGHVVLPLLEREFVSGALISTADFLAGYGVVQAMPGPLFTYASFLGAAISGWTGAIIATGAIFAPGFLLLLAVLPFWGIIRSNPSVQSAIMGMNAAVVGLLAAALYDPILTDSITSKMDMALFAVYFGLMVFWKAPPWLVVLAGAITGFFLL